MCVARCAPDGATYLQTVDRNLQGCVAIQTSTIYSNSSSVFLQHNINGVMYRKEEAGDSLNNKLERQSRTEVVSNIVSLSVLNNFELCYRGTGPSWSRGGGFGNCCVFFGP